MPALIQVKDLDFYYDRGKPSEQHALKKVDLEIERGDYVAFFGPSGCGKSTLLSSIAGIERPTSGEIMVEGKSIARANDDVLAIYRQTEVGIIFQNFNLIPSLTVLDNTAMPMAFLGIRKSEREDKARAVLKRLGITDFAGRYPFELSGGQQQRAGIARALVNEQPITLADEPLGNLDSENANKVLEFLKELNEKDGKTVIMVTHEAWSLRDAQVIFHMKDGEIVKIEDRRTGKITIPGGAHAANLPQAASLTDRARAVAPLLLKGYPEAQILRLERFLAQLLANEITKEDFVESLNKSYRAGGVGLWKQRAKHIGDMVINAIEHEAEIAELHQNLKAHPKTSFSEDIRNIRDWIFEERKTAFDLHTSAIVNKLIEGRIRGEISASEFAEKLSLPKSQGGAGIAATTALRAAEKMELGMNNAPA